MAIQGLRFRVESRVSGMHTSFASFVLTGPSVPIRPTCIQNVRDQYRIFEINAEYSRSMQNIRDQYRIFEINTEYSRSIHNVRDQYRIFEINTEYSRSIQNLRDRYRIFENVIECSRIPHGMLENKILLTGPSVPIRPTCKKNVL